MAYRVRKGRLFFEPRTGNGPCRRRRVGEASRRILIDRTEDGLEARYHATKGWRFKRVAPAAGA